MSNPRLRIRECRLAAGLTQVAAAKRAGMHPVTWNDIEGGKNANPTMKTMRKVAAALGVTLDELVVT